MTETDLPPLVVDLDGTLTPTDTLMESLVQVVKRSPVNLLFIPCWLLQGRAGFKAAIALRTTLEASRLPYRQTLLDYLRQEKSKGRQIILATAARQEIAQGVAAHLGLFDAVLATQAGHNLKGKAKLQAIQKMAGENFVYAGDHVADLAIWRAAKAAVLVGMSERLAKQVRKIVPVEQEFIIAPPGLRTWARALRVHQWLKNLLLFVPMLTAFSFTSLDKFIAVTIAFISFSLAASATYILNDISDLDSDRVHPRKRNRPFASAALPITHGVMVSLIMLMLAVILAWAVSYGFLLMLLTYLLLTITYSWKLKRFVLFDVIVLSLLYTLRILAGAVAIEVVISSWLLAFSCFIFLSLALVKRCAELVFLRQDQQLSTQGRDYRVSDLEVLWPLGIGAALSSVVVFGLFISAPETLQRYGSPEILWVVAVGLIYWLSRLWIKTSRGEMHDDPVVYAIKDRGSCLTVLAMIATIVAAKFLNTGFTG